VQPANRPDRKQRHDPHRPTSAHAATYREHVTAINAAVNHANPDLTPEALTRHQTDAISNARTQLATAIPAQPDDVGAKRAAVLAARAPQTADQIAAMTHEQSKVAALLGAGQSRAEILATASPVRAAAILDSIETAPDVLASNDRDAIKADVTSAIFDRLVELGEPDAVDALQAETAAAHIAAWSQGLTELQQTGNIGVGTRSAIYVADPTGYAEAFSDGLTTDNANVQRIQAAARRSA
jgi:hypothetical protein